MKIRITKHEIRSTKFEARSQRCFEIRNSARLPDGQEFEIYPPGQGLLEATLAIGMILVGLGAVLALTIQNVSATVTSTQRFTAAQLAREGIEAVRAVRDSNWLAAGHSDSGRAWDDGLSDATCITDCNGSLVMFDVGVSPRKLTINFVPTRDVDDPAQAELELYRHFQNYIWVQSSPAPDASGGYYSTGYRRLVLLDPVCRLNDSPNTIQVQVGERECPDSTWSKIGLRVEAIVSWPAGGIFGGQGRRRLALVEYLYNWR